MKNNSFISYLVFSLFILKNIWLKIAIICVILFLIYMNKYEKFNKKEIFIDLIYFLLIFIMNKLLTIDMDVINFIYFVVVNVAVHNFVINIKKETYFSIYFFLVLLGGVMKVWLNF